MVHCADFSQKLLNICSVYGIIRVLGAVPQCAENGCVPTANIGRYRPICRKSTKGAIMTDYLYYKKNYKGDVINDKTDFEKYEKRAAQFVRSVINTEAQYDENELYDCICAIAEQLCENGEFRSIKSETTDGYSVTYSDSLKKHLYELLRLYLPKELLYRGL